MLLFQLALGLDVFLLQLGDQIVLQFDLLKATIVASVGLRGFDTVFVLVVLESLDQLMKFPDLVLVASNFVLQFLQLVF